MPVSDVREEERAGHDSDDSERFIALALGQFTANCGLSLQTTQQKFEERLATVLDNARSFIAKTLKKQSLSDKAVRGEASNCSAAE
jgi:hypothetical protein